MSLRGLGLSGFYRVLVAGQPCQRCVLVANVYS